MTRLQQTVTGVHYEPAAERPHRYQRPDGPVGLRGPRCCRHGYNNPVHAPTWQRCPFPGCARDPEHRGGHRDAEGKLIKKPKAVTAAVVGAADEAAAREVGPLLAERLFPGRRYGVALHAERVGDRWTVSVEDRGPIRRYITTQGIDPSQRPR